MSGIKTLPDECVEAIYTLCSDKSCDPFSTTVSYSAAIAAYYDNIDKVKQIVDSGNGVYRTTNEIICIAAIMGRASRVMDFIYTDDGIKFNDVAECIIGNTVAHVGDIELFKKFRGAFYHGNIKYAVIKKHCSFIEQLLLHIDNIEELYSTHATMARTAAEENDKEMLTFTLETAVVEDPEDFEYLMEAAVEVLVKNSNIDMLDVIYGHNLVDLYQTLKKVILGDSVAIIEWLLSKYDFPNVRDPKMLFNAVCWGKFSTAKILQQHGWETDPIEVMKWLKHNHKSWTQFVSGGLCFTNNKKLFKRNIAGFKNLTEFGYPIGNDVREYLAEIGDNESLKLIGE